METQFIEIKIIIVICIEEDNLLRFISKKLWLKREGESSIVSTCFMIPFLWRVLLAD